MAILPWICARVSRIVFSTLDGFGFVGSAMHGASSVCKLVADCFKGGLFDANRLSASFTSFAIYGLQLL